MTNYTLGYRHQLQSDFEEIISIIKGRSIVSAGDMGNSFEIGLSGNLMVRLYGTDTEMTINILSTRNSDENPTLVIDMGDMKQRVPIHVIETKLKALRTLYAIYYLVHDNRAQDLEYLLLANPDSDIEDILLEENEKLYVESISYGSWVLTVWGETKKAYLAINSVAGLVFERGREAYLSKIEANTRIRQSEADLKAVEVKDKIFDLGKKQFDFLTEASDTLKSPEAKEILKNKLIEMTKNFTSGDKSDGESYKSLE